MKDTAHILQLIKQSVSETAPGATLILYGSYARGDYREDSDIDLLILMDRDRVTIADRTKVSSPLYRIELETGIIISSNFYTRDTWETKHRITPFYQSVTREGIVL